MGVKHASAVRQQQDKGFLVLFFEKELLPCCSLPPIRRHQPHAKAVPMLTDRDSMLRKLHELRSEHRDLDTVIARLTAQPMDQLQVQRLKKRKLLLKDEISWLESRLIPDNIA